MRIRIRQNCCIVTLGPSPVITTPTYSRAAIAHLASRATSTVLNTVGLNVLFINEETILKFCSVHHRHKNWFNTFIFPPNIFLKIPIPTVQISSYCVIGDETGLEPSCLRLLLIAYDSKKMPLISSDCH